MREYVNCGSEEIYFDCVYIGWCSGNVFVVCLWLDGNWEVFFWFFVCECFLVGLCWEFVVRLYNYGVFLVLVW